MTPQWQVVGQRQTSVLSNGSFTDAMVVTFRTASGVVGSVTVPMPTYNAKHVSELISEQVHHIEAVHALSAGAPPSSS